LFASSPNSQRAGYCANSFGVTLLRNSMRHRRNRICRFFASNRSSVSCARSVGDTSIMGWTRFSPNSAASSRVGITHVIGPGSCAIANPRTLSCACVLPTCVLA
jgi:hypothetical protein